MRTDFHLIMVFVCSLFFMQIGILSAAPAVGASITDQFSGVQFVWVPKGCFLPAGVKAVKSNKPKMRNKVIQGDLLIDFSALDASDMNDTSSSDMQQGNQTCLSQGFWMAKFEITQGQYQKVMGTNPSSFKKGNNYPVENIRWLDARAFVRKLNQATGKHYRLPSEMEWEYAARSGGYKQSYGAPGNAKGGAWYMDNSNNSTHPVGNKNINGLGLFDMSGNVWEWTQDCWHTDVSKSPKDGSPWTLRHCENRVLRGGSWFDAKDMITTKTRVYNATDKTDNNSGFRIVLD